MQPQQLDEGASSGESSTTATIPATEADSTPELTTTSPTSDDPSSSTSYSCDLGLWPADVLDSMREYWAAKGSGDCNNSDAQSWKLIRRLSNNFQNVPPSPYTMLMCA